MYLVHFIGTTRTSRGPRSFRQEWLHGKASSSEFLHPLILRLFWDENSFFFAVKLRHVNTTPEKFENGISTLKTHQMFSSTLRQKILKRISPYSFWVCVKNSGRESTGLSRGHHVQNLRFKNVFSLHAKTKTVKFLQFEDCFRKALFRDGLVRRIDLTVEIKLCFSHSPGVVLCGCAWTRDNCRNKAVFFTFSWCSAVWMRLDQGPETCTAPMLCVGSCASPPSWLPRRSLVELYYSTLYFAIYDVIISHGESLWPETSLR